MTAAPPPSDQDRGARTSRRRKGVVWGLVFLTAVTAAFVFRDEILAAALDPKTPFQTYEPPPAPDYASPASWALLPDAADRGPVDVFFIHPTTYNGGEEWVGPIDHPRSRRLLARVMLPNYAGPFQRVGPVFAPRYRQASLYAMMTAREDARDARAFAYDDVRRAFRRFAARGQRPFIIAGVEQGASIGARMLSEEVTPDPALKARLVAAYLIAAAVRDDLGAPPCVRRDQSGCVVAWIQAQAGEDAHAARLRDRALVWDKAGRLVPLGARLPMCVNPLIGSNSEALGPQSANLGAVNASNLEWGLRPAFLPRQVSAQCRDGVLRVSRPTSPTLRPARGWAERLKALRYNAFYADLEVDAQARAAAYAGAVRSARQGT